MKNKVFHGWKTIGLCALVSVYLLAGCAAEKDAGDAATSPDAQVSTAAASPDIAGVSGDAQQGTAEGAGLTVSVPVTTQADEHDHGHGHAHEHGHEHLDYGVFTGMDPEKVIHLHAFKELVVDAYHLDEHTVAHLKEANEHVYAYLNIGSVEPFRDSHELFGDRTFADCEHQPGVRWILPTTEGWSEYLLSKAEQYKNWNVDGLYLDNADVFLLDPAAGSFEAIFSLLRKLKEMDLKIIVNRGEQFVAKLLETEGGRELIDGVSQEFVFTAYDYMNKVFYFNNEKSRDRLLAHLETCAAAGLDVYLLEYMKSAHAASCETANCACETADAQKDKEMAEFIRKYCEERGYFYYLAPCIDLD